jgi:hypothetical protein
MSQFIVQITVFNAIVHSTVQNPMWLIFITIGI